MKKLLIVATLDIQYYHNNRIHHIIEQMSTKFDEVVVLYKAIVPPGTSFKNQIRSFFSLKIGVTQVNNITWLRVSPFFNRLDGLGLTLLGLQGPDEVPPSSIQKAIRKILSFLGLFVELFIPLSFICAYFLKVGGKFDVFIGQGPQEMVCGFFLKKIRKVVLLVYDDFDYIPGLQLISSLRARYTSWFEATMLKRSDIIISVSSLLAQLREEQTGKHVYIIPNGVVYGLLQEAQNKIPHPPTLIYMGYVSWWSGLDLVLLALSKARKEIPNLRLIVAGHTSHHYLDNLMRVVKDLNIEKHFLYVGSMTQKDLIPYLRQSDIGLAIFKPVELRKYAFPLKVIEYMSAGLPVITTQDTQAALIINQHSAGVCTRYESDDLERAFYDLLTDKRKYEMCARNAIISAKEYDWNILMKREYDLINNLSMKTTNGIQHEVV